MPTAIRLPTLGSSTPLDIENESLDQLRQLSRSSHPYHRRQSEIYSPTDQNGHLTEVGSEWSTSSPIRISSGRGIGQEGGSHTGIPSRGWHDSSKSPSDSGTEADDEGNGFLKGLPAPPHRPRKGLRDARGLILSTTPSPSVTPSHLEAEHQALSLDNTGERRSSTHAWPSANGEVEKARERTIRRRRAELVRRSSEVVLLGIIGCIVYHGMGASGTATYWRIGEGHLHCCFIEDFLADML